jgi:hypothetical protein
MKNSNFEKMNIASFEVLTSNRMRRAKGGATGPTQTLNGKNKVKNDGDDGIKND